MLVTGDANNDDTKVWPALTMQSPLIVTVFFLKNTKHLEKDYCSEQIQKFLLLHF